MLNGLIRLAEILKDLAERFTPHPGQIPIGRAIFYNKFKRIFCACGRSFGKSRIAAYLAVRFARENANTTNFIFGPFIGQMKEIYWTTKLIHNLIPEDEIESINATEMRITLTNGSFIRICGSDNYESFRGIKLNPNSLCVFDELKDLRKEFLDAFLPNLSVNDPTLMMIGTPPYRENHFIHFMEHAKSDPNWFFYHAPTAVNPHVSREFLDQQKAFLIANGMEDVWLAEYEAKYTLGGHRSIFPMVPRMPVKTLEEAWPKDSNKWILHVGFDPASTSVFGITFFLYNQYVKKVIAVGEIYENRPEQMTARKIYDTVNDRIEAYKRLGIKYVEFTYDSAAAWFANEIRDIDKDGKWWLAPCDKSSGLQGEISCWRGVLAHGHFTFTDAVPKLRWEMENYILDEKGRLPDKDDHLIQSGVYSLIAMGFDFTEALEPRTVENNRRAYRMEDEIVRQDSLEGLE